MHSLTNYHCKSGMTDDDYPSIYPMNWQRLAPFPPSLSSSIVHSFSSLSLSWSSTYTPPPLPCLVGRRCCGDWVCRSAFLFALEFRLRRLFRTAFGAGNTACCTYIEIGLRCFFCTALDVTSSIRRWNTRSVSRCNSSRIFDILALFFELSFGFESESKDALFVSLCHCRPFEKWLPCPETRSDFSSQPRFSLNSFVREAIVGSVKPRSTAISASPQPTRTKQRESHDPWLLHFDEKIHTNYVDPDGNGTIESPRSDTSAVDRLIQQATIKTTISTLTHFRFHLQHHFPTFYSLLCGKYRARFYRKLTPVRGGFVTESVTSTPLYVMAERSSLDEFPGP